MANPILLPIVLMALTGGTFLLNEWTHGGVSEAMGMGTHHLTPDRAWDCPHDLNQTPCDEMPHEHGRPGGGEP